MQLAREELEQAYKQMKIDWIVENVQKKELMAD